MCKQFSYKALEQLINDVKAARPSERDTFVNTPSSWKYELSLHPDRFRMDNGELLWLGCKVGTIGNEQKQDEFWNMVNRLLLDGVIYEVK